MRPASTWLAATMATAIRTLGKFPTAFSAHITAVSKRPATNAVVDVANATVWEDKAVLEFFETSGRNLLAA